MVKNLQWNFNPPFKPQIHSFHSSFLSFFKHIFIFIFKLIYSISQCILLLIKEYCGKISGAGRKKNRQKERRLMKGFNIVPQPGGSGSLPPVAEYNSTFQQSQKDNKTNTELSRSTLSGIFAPVTTIKKNYPHHISTNSVPASCAGTNGANRIGSRKKKWGALIEAAKVRSKLIGTLF